MLAALLIIWLLPAGEEKHEVQPSVRAQLREVAHQQVWASYLVVILAMIGSLAFSVYQVPLMEEITRLDPAVVPFYLFAGGLGSVLGAYLGGRLADWKLMPAVFGILITQIALALVMLAAVRDPVLMGIAIVLWSGANFALNAPIQVRILNAARAAPNMAATLVSSAYNIGIAAGAFLGAMLLSGGLGYGWLPAVGVVTSALALAVAVLSNSAERRAAQETRLGSTRTDFTA